MLKRAPVSGFQAALHPLGHDRVGYKTDRSSSTEILASRRILRSVPRST